MNSWEPPTLTWTKHSERSPGVRWFRRAPALQVQGLNGIITGDLDGAAKALTKAIQSFGAGPPSRARADPRFFLAVVLHALGELERAGDVMAEFGSMLPLNSPDWGRVGSIAAVLEGRNAFAGVDTLLDVLDDVTRSPLEGAIDEWLTGAAAVLIRRGHVEDGARLLSWVRSVTLDRGIPSRHPASFLLYRHYVSIARGVLPAADARRVRSEGSSLDQDRAIIEAEESLRAVVTTAYPAVPPAL